MCEKCNSLMGCNTHICATALRLMAAEPVRSAPTLRLPTDPPNRVNRPTSRMPSTISLLDIAAKQ